MKNARQLSTLVNMASPEAVLEEVKNNFINFYSISEFDIVRKIFFDMERLFGGKYPGYRKCNTPYHDVNHNCDVLLAFSRLADGYNIKEEPISVVGLKAGLAAAIMHDTGYIQSDSETDGTGARYTDGHVKRSMDFLKAYGAKEGLSAEFIRLAVNAIHATSLSVDIKEIEFQSAENRKLGAMLATADLIGQMSSRTYLEKLLYLYEEFQEAGMPGYGSELDLLKKTAEFYDSLVSGRLNRVLEGVHRYSVGHFNKRYGIEKNLYMDAIEKQLKYLRGIIDKTPQDYRKKLRRDK